MKLNYLLIALFISISDLAAQMIPSGVTLIDTPNYQARFIFSDKNSNLWFAPNPEYNAGLFHYDATYKKTVDFASGAFSGHAASSNYLYFSSAAGLYTFYNGSFSLNGSMTALTDVAVYKDSLYSIDTLQQLYKFKNGSFASINLNLSSGTKLNTLYADKNFLWISTSDGLLRFDGNSAKQFKVGKPSYTDSEYKALFNNIDHIVSDGNKLLYAYNSAGIVLTLDGDSLIPFDLSTLADCNKKNLVPLTNGNILTNSKDEILLYTYYYVMVLGDTDKLYIPDYDLYKKEHNTCDIAPFYGGGSDICIDSNDDIYFSKYRKLYKIDVSQYNDKQVRSKYTSDYSHGRFEGNNLIANICNNGFMFSDNAPHDDFYDDINFGDKELSCANLLQSAGLSLGARIGNSVYISGNLDRFKGSDFYPGPLDTSNGRFDSLSAAPYNRIWKVSSAQIQEFRKNYGNSAYVIPKDILEWPAHGTGSYTRNMAPFVDTDGNGLYEPAKGDYPRIKGDLMYWWVFNDVFNRGASGAKPLNVEVHASCYAFTCNDFNTNDSEFVLNRSLFFDFKFINRSGRDYEQFYAGTINKSGLGYPYDNYIGCDVQMNAGYLYNTNRQDNSSRTFGNKSPMLFCKLLNQEMSSFSQISNSNDPVIGYPRIDYDYYNYLSGRWMNGNEFSFGGSGSIGSIKTKYLFDGNTNWSTKAYPKWTEKSAGNGPGFRIFEVNADLKSFKPDSAKSIELAYIFMQKDSNDFFNNYNYFRKGLRLVQSWYDQQSFPSCAINYNSIDNTRLSTPYKIYPNPGGFDLYIDNPQSKIRFVEIVDLSGKVVLQKSAGTDQSTIVFDISRLSSGAYLVRIASTDGISYNKFVKL